MGPNENLSFLDKVDSIHRKFIESLVTGPRDPKFVQPRPKPQPKPELGDESQPPLGSSS